MQKIKHTKQIKQPTQEQMMEYFLMSDFSKMNFPEIPTPEWITILGLDLKKMSNDKVIQNMYYDSDGMIHVTLSNDVDN